MKRNFMGEQFIKIVALFSYMLATLFHFGFLFPQNDTNALFWMANTILLLVLAMVYSKREV